jgi:hypothetical protein
MQHLGYHEFFELRRVAQRTIEQKQVIVNNLAIRRGVEEFAGCNSLEQLQTVLLGIFAENDFDGFDLQYALRQNGRRLSVAGAHRFAFRWNRNAGLEPAMWRMNLDLASPAGEGCFLVYRRRCEKPLMVDINLLGGEFLNALRATLRRLLVDRTQELEQVAIVDAHAAAQVGTARAHSIGTA